MMYWLISGAVFGLIAWFGWVVWIAPVMEDDE